MKEKYLYFGVFLSLFCVSLIVLISACKKSEDKTVVAPSLTTKTPSSITATTADVGGYVSSDGGANVTERGVCYSTSQTPTVSDFVVAEGGGTGNFQCTLSGLDPSTKYYARAYALNSAGTGYGNQVSFTTLTSAGLPTVTTSAISNITQNSAQGGGNITNDGGTQVTQKGVCWSTSPSPTISDNYTTDGSGTGSFTSDITGLTASTKYYIRAYAINSSGTAYGENKTFSTISTQNDWIQLSSGTDADLFSVFFINPNSGWAVGTNGTILHTTNGGNSWIQQESGVNYSLNKVIFLDNMDGWVSTNLDSDKLLHTTNGGQTWTLQSVADLYPYYSNPINIFFLNNLIGYCVVFAQLNSDVKYHIYKTSNGGLSWVKKYTFNNIVLEDIFFINENTGWFCTNLGKIYKTTDGGLNWNSLSISSSYSYRSIIFTSSMVGWVCGFPGVIYHTTDGGLSWSLQKQIASGALNAISFIDSNNGWAVGGWSSHNSTIIYHTSDGGNMWLQQNTPANSLLLGSSIVNTSVGYAVGNGGTILKIK